MQRTLEDVDLNRETLDELLITVPSCKHVFTIETLDGHCGMTEYYRREGLDGRWIGLRTPPYEFQRPPTCPTCRKAITCPRYGRIFKRADLDILERNVASSMSRSIGKAHRFIESFSKAEAESALVAAAASVKLNNTPVKPQLVKNRERARNAMLKAKYEGPVPVEALDPGNKKLHGALFPGFSAWSKVTKDLIHGYHQVSTVAKTRHAHTSAWEAAFSFLFEREMDLASADPARAPRNPHDFAMRSAKMAIGQPPPRADKTHLVEAFWASLHIRFALVSLAQTWLKAVRSKGSSYPAEQCQIWACYTAFLLQTCLTDAQRAFDIALESESRRQMTRTSLLIMRANLEQFCFNLEMSRQTGMIKTNRDSLVKIATEKANDAVKYANDTTASHRLVKWPDMSKEEEWLEATFSSGAHVIIDEWRTIRVTLRSGTFYEEVSLNEKMAIIGALSAHYEFCKSHYAPISNPHSGKQ
jgi:hypothetical protein